MLQLLPKSDIITPNTANAEDTISYINTYIDKYHCKVMGIDISALNIIDACYVTTMCSTKHYIKYPDGKINWKVSSILVKELNKNLELGNSSYII